MMAWVDVESTGLDTTLDELLEVGIIITDDDLNELGSIEVVIDVTSFGLRRILDNEIVEAMHTETGLLERIKRGGCAKVAEADKKLCEFLGGFGDTPMPMCGSSVHFDRAMLRRWMPEFEAMFFYRNIDCSTLKELALRWWPAVADAAPKGRKLHRVIPDIEDSIAELAYYRKSLGEIAF